MNASCLYKVEEERFLHLIDELDIKAEAAPPDISKMRC